MTGGGASWQPGSADWSIPAWAFQSNVLSWNDRACLCLIKTSGPNAGPNRVMQVSRRSDVSLRRKENETHFTEKREIVQDVFPDPAHVRWSVRTAPRPSLGHSTATWMITLVSEGTSLQGGFFFFFFLPGGTLWWHHTFNEGVAYSWGSSPEGWMEHLGDTLTVKQHYRHVDLHVHVHKRLRTPQQSKTENILSLSLSFQKFLLQFCLTHPVMALLQWLQDKNRNFVAIKSKLKRLQQEKKTNPSV